MFTLRDYQAASVSEVQKNLDSCGSSLLVLATGLGKTIVFAELAAHYWNDLGLRTMVVAPKNVLVDQAAEKIYKRTGFRPAIERAQERSNESEWGQSPFVVASAQTLTMANRRTGVKRFRKFTNIGLLVIDEAHERLTPPTIEMVDHFKERGGKVLAVTATPKRLDGVGMKNIVESVAYSMGILDGINGGWLVSPEASIVQIKSLDLKSVRTHGSKGDFVEAELQKVMEEERVTYEIAEVVARESGTLKTAVFCASVAQAKKVAELLADTYQLRTGWICSDKRLCSDDQRSDVMHSFTEVSDGIQIVCNVGILTTGWDFAGLQHIVMARPTKSASLYEQVMGRGTRPLPGVVDFDDSTAEQRLAAIATSDKPHFKMTDLVDNSLLHKLVTSLDVLAGHAPKEAIDRAKDIAADESLGRTCAELLAQAKAELEAEEREKRRLEEEAKRIAQDRERERLARYKGEADYSTHKVDPFDPMQRGAGKRNGERSKVVFPFGNKHKGDNISDIETSYLKWAIDTCKLKPYLKSAIERELESRDPHEVAHANDATHKQVYLMKKLGIFIPEGCTRKQASQLIDAKKNPKPQTVPDDSEAPWEGESSFNPDIGF